MKMKAEEEKWEWEEVPGVQVAQRRYDQVEDLVSP